MLPLCLTRSSPAGTRWASIGAGTLSALHDAGGTLAGLLDSIDDDKLCQVIRLVEATGQRRTLEPAIADLRPRLRRLRPPRSLTLSRLVAIPLAPILDQDAGASFSIARERLAFWQAQVIERLDPMLAATTRAALVGHTVDDEAAVVAAGRRLWPAAARLLAAEAVTGATASLEAERWRIVDLFDIADQLVPHLGRLSPVLVRNDDDERPTVSAILALAEGGPPDRLATLAALLLRRACPPSALADRLTDLAPPALRRRLADVLQRLLAEHRAGLVRQLASLAADPEPSLARTIETLATLAEVIADPKRAAPAERFPRPAGKPPPSGDLEQLRQTAATLARARYAAAIEHLLTPLPLADVTGGPASIADREAAARQIARLGDLVRRLSPASSIHELTGAAIERLVDLQARRRGGAKSLVTVDDARLIEILAGPELARRYVASETGGRTG